MATIFAGIILEAVKAARNLQGNRSGNAALVGHRASGRLVLLSPVPLAWWEPPGGITRLPADGSSVAAWCFGAGAPGPRPEREPRVIATDHGARFIGVKEWNAWALALPLASGDTLKEWGGWQTVRTWESFGTVRTWVRRFEATAPSLLSP